MSPTRTGDGWNEPRTIAITDADEARALELLEERADAEIDANADIWVDWLLHPTAGPDGAQVAQIVAWALNPPRDQTAASIERSRLRHAYHEYRAAVAESGPEWGELIDQAIREADE